MTREEYIDFANALKNNYTIDFDKLPEFCDMAISALSENKGEWIKIQSGDKDFPEIIVCNKCYHENSHLDFNEHNEPIGKVFVKSNFCPNCGAYMRGETYGKA